jgi:hypothetical protein
VRLAKRWSSDSVVLRPQHRGAYDEQEGRHQVEQHSVSHIGRQSMTPSKARNGAAVILSRSQHLKCALVTASPFRRLPFPSQMSKVGISLSLLRVDNTDWAA